MKVLRKYKENRIRASKLKNGDVVGIEGNVCIVFDVSEFRETVYTVSLTEPRMHRLIEFDDTVILFPNACLILDGDKDA